MKNVKTWFLALLALILSGCAATSGAPAAATTHPREYATLSVAGGSVAFSRTRAYEKDEGLLVTGRVRRMHKLPLPGHVDLVVCAPDGTALAREKVRILGLASNRKGILELPFRINLALVPPEGAIIRLRYHPPASREGEPGCTPS